MNAGMLSTLPMRASMRSTASLAPPWRGPYSAPTAPAMAVYTSTPLGGQGGGRQAGPGPANWGMERWGGGGAKIDTVREGRVWDAQVAKVVEEG